MEGGAADVFAGETTTLDRFRPSLYLELHGSEEQQAVNDYLIARGFVCKALDGQVVSDAAKRWVSPLICTKNGPRG